MIRVALLASQQHNVDAFGVSKQPAIFRNPFSSTRLNAVSSVWAQLYYERKDEPNGRPVVIEPIPKNIGALKEAVKAKLKPKLDYAPVNEIFVFPPDTTPPFLQDKAIGNQKRYKPGKPLEEVIEELKNTTPPTSDDHPLIVVAPAPRQQPAYEMASTTMAGLVDSGICHSLEECPEPVYPVNNPSPFVCDESWLEDMRDVIQENLDKDELRSADRIPPLCLARCSRGGKTRGLYSIVDSSLKNNEESKEDGNDNNNNNGGGSFDFKSLVVSFSDSSALCGEEQDDPLAALTRRIAFAAYTGEKTTKNFDDIFRPMVVSDESVRKWLGETRCLLLIDELNQLENLVNPTAQAEWSTEKFAQFLRSNFLRSAGRYFVFTTHEAFVTEKLAALMESKSNRNFVHRALPLIPSLNAARKAFDWEDLNAREAIYCGLIPGLILMKRKLTFPTVKREEAVKKFLDTNYDEYTVLRLLKSLITGDEESVPESLEQLMDMSDGGKIRWIPDHMVYVLNEIADKGSDKLSDELRSLVRKIADLFDQFRGAKTYGGDGWEALFGVVLLVRILTKQSDHLIDLSPFLWVNREFKTSFNQPFNVPTVTQFWDSQDVDALMAAIPEKLEGAHVAIYYPPHASFEEYDILVVMWDAAGNRFKVIGYQLKEGKEIPSDHARSGFENFVVRGKAAQEPKKLRNWEIASDDQIESFFGSSGVQWTPKRWKELKDSTCLTFLKCVVPATERIMLFN